MFVVHAIQLIFATWARIGPILNVILDICNTRRERNDWINRYYLVSLLFLFLLLLLVIYNVTRIKSGKSPTEFCHAANEIIWRTKRERNDAKEANREEEQQKMWKTNTTNREMPFVYDGPSRLNKIERKKKNLNRK